mmetsp:Transcript_6764/g.28396  ORF Transcript_6764/g.28396 Transcript_6764/m.28396 type:complete len:476 (-) Transcript_6764:3208-4635(-)
MALAKFPANIEAQTGATAAGGEEGLEQMAFDLGRHRRPGAAHDQLHRVGILGQRDADGTRPVIGMAPGVVQQVHEHPTQMFGIEQHLQSVGRDRQTEAALRTGFDPVDHAPVHAGLVHQLAGVQQLAFDNHAGRDLGHIVHQALEPLHIGSDHLRQLHRAWRGGVLGQQRVGLRDGRERVADLVRDARRHPPHRGQLFLPDARQQIAAVLDEHHAQLLAAVALAREPQAQTKGAADPAGLRQRDVLLGDAAVGIGLLQRKHQRLPIASPAQLPAQLGAEGTEQCLCRGVHRAHAAAAVDHQHALLHLVDDQLIEQLLLPRQRQAAARGLFLAGQPGAQLAGQQAHREQAAADQPRLCQLDARQLTEQLRPGRRRQQCQCGNRGRGQRQPPRTQHRGHQHRHHEQGAVVHATCIERMQRAEQHQVHPHGGPPVRAADARQAARRRATPQRRPQPQRQRRPGIGDAQHQGRVHQAAQ